MSEKGNTERTAGKGRKPKFRVGQKVVWAITPLSNALTTIRSVFPRKRYRIEFGYLVPESELSAYPKEPR